MADSLKDTLNGLLAAPPHRDPVGAVAARHGRRRTRGTAAVAVVSALAVVVAAGPFLLRDDPTPREPSVGAGPSAAPASCEFRPAPAQQPSRAVAPPPADAVAPARSTAQIVLGDGKLVVELLGSEAPCAVASFRHLAAQGFYDRSSCHRLTTAGFFVIQCGDPTGTGTGGPGYELDAENLAGATYPAGTLALANGGPGRSGSQFFLVYKDSPLLPPDYTPFGRVTQGLDVLLRAAARGQDGTNGGSDGRPLPPGVDVQRIRLAPSPSGSDRDRWRTAGSDDYTFTLRLQCYCPARGDQRISVVAGQVVKVEALDGERPRELDRFEVSIDSLFDLIENEEGVASVQAEYDSKYGYPTKIEVDVEANAIDDEYTYLLSDYRPTG